MLSFIIKFLKDNKAVAASEFALVAPIMVLLWCGTVETAWVFSASRKVMAASHTLADLVSQEEVVDDAKLDNIVNAVSAIMAPHKVNNLRVNISSVRFDSTGDGTLVWEEVVNGEPKGNSPVDGAFGLGLDGESVIVATISFDYDPLFADLILGKNITLSERSYSKPRKTSVIYRN